jgi:glycosyltransferase involved in cell wall biosynthesis
VAVMADFLIVIPAYNEEANIRHVLEELLKRKLPADIVVVNDGSIDATESIARSFPVMVVTHPTNLGYGAALQTGYKWAAKKGYSYVLQFDSDGQHDPDDLNIIMEKLREGTADVVIGSRFLGDPKFYPGAAKMTAITLFRILIRLCAKTKITDPTSGLRGMSRNVFGFYSVRDRFPSDYPDANTVIQMLLNSFTVCEVPIHSKERNAGVSMHSGIRPFLYMLKILISIVSVVLNHQIVKWGKSHG